MKVLFLTEGGRQKGLGHIARCIALSEGLRDVVDNAEMLFIYEGDEIAASLFNDSAIAVELDAWQTDSEVALKHAEGSDLVVIDSYFADQILYERLSEAVSGNILMIDDNNRIKYPRGMVLNPSVYAPSIDYSLEDGTRYLLGRDYILLRRDFWNVPEKNIRGKVKKIMITLGGSSLSGLAEDLSGPIEKEFGVIINKIDPLKGVVSAEDMIECAIDSDICVSGAGQTLYELLRIGLPTIAVELAENQNLNITSLDEMGFIEKAGTNTDEDLGEYVIEAIKRLLDSDRRLKISASGRDMIDGKGALRAARAIVEQVKGPFGDSGIKIRPMEQRDCYDIWAWRNNPAVRKRSFSKDSIDYLAHKSWFDEKMQDSAESLYICENGDLDKIGQARFGQETGEVYISVNLNPVFIGRGIGQRLIDMATRKFMSTNMDAGVVKAKVENDNIASKKVFEKAGYVLEEEMKDHLVYVKKDNI